MTHEQNPVGTGFGRLSTTFDVLDGIDLRGKRALVTGGYSGLGLETTRALSRAGAHVTVPARRPELARRELAGIARTEVAAVDLADLGSVAAFTDAVLAAGAPLDMVILSAAIMANPRTVVGPGWESQFAVNHLGHFALVNRLWPAISDDARVVSVSSGRHQASGIQWHDLHGERSYDRWVAYAQSKTANVLMAVELDRRGRERGVRAFSLHPGVIRTPLQRHFSHDEMVEMGWIEADGTPRIPFKTPEQGAATQVFAAASPLLEGLGGVYLEDCDVAPAEHVAPHATDLDEASRLWALSAELTGVDAFGPVGAEG